MKTSKIRNKDVAFGEHHEDGNERGPRTCIPARYLLAITGCIGLATAHGFKMNIGYVLIAMVNHTAVASNRPIIPMNSTVHRIENSESICEYEPEFENTATVSRSILNGPFIWDERIQNMIPAAQLWGAFIMQIPAGRMSELYSPKWMIIASVLINMLASLITPLVAQIHYTAFVALRTLQGIGTSMVYPALHVLISRWSVPTERGIFASIIYTGMTSGVMMSSLVTGMLVNYVRWDTMFYIEGILPIIWCLVSWLLIQDSPEQQTRFMSRREKDYIARSLKKHQGQLPEKKLSVPWGPMFRSVPFWAILISHMSSIFGWLTIVTQLPMYLFHILKLSPDRIAAFMTAMFISSWIYAIIFAKIITAFVKRGKITLTESRRIAMGTATVIAACCFFSITLAGCNRALVISLMFVTTTCLGAIFCGFMVNHVDIAPNFAGTMIAITHACSSIAGLGVPIVVATFTHGNQTLDAWRNVFYIVTGSYLLDFICYVTMSSAEVQPWNDLSKSVRDLADRTDTRSEIVSLKTNSCE